ncbi:hypothetical protein J6590_051820 [Homalodisca vitripennis]|nr:hypothetical protein J6590_051820 [Homalodisca vitripennis]
MDLPPFIKHFPFLFKIGSFCNIHTGQYKNSLVLLRLFTNVGLFLSTVFCMMENEFEWNNLEKLHDLLGLLLFISSDLVLIGCKEQMLHLAQLLEEPFDFWELGSPQAVAFERYTKDIKINGSITFLYIVLCCICWATMPLWYIFGFVSDPSEKQFHLLLGWIPCSVESYYVIVGLYVSSVLLCLTDLGVFFSWFLAMIFCVLKIKFKLRILRADLETLDQRADQLMRQKLKSLLSHGTLTSCRQCRKSFRKPVAGDARVNARECLWFTGISGARGCCKEAARNTMLQECYNYHIKSAAIQHREIIRVIAVVDKCFKPLIMVFSQLGVIIMALATPKLGSVSLTSYSFVYPDNWDRK